MKKIIFTALTFVVCLSIQAQVGINTITPTSTLDVEGSFATKTEFLSLATTTLDETHHTVVGNNLTVILPSPNLIIGREYIIKTLSASSGPITVSPSGTDLINGANTSIILGAYESLTVIAIGSNEWSIVSSDTGAKEINDLSDGKTLDNSIYLGLTAGVTAAAGNSDRNVVVGDGSALALNGGDDNVIIGESGGVNLTTGSNNVFLGQGAGSDASSGVTTGSSNILIGQNVQALGQAISNELNIGDAIYATGLYSGTANVGIGNTNSAPNSTLSVNGSMSMPIRYSAVATTLTDTDYTLILENATVQAANVTLPSAVGRIGRIYIINSAGSGNQRLLPAGSETINGNANFNLNNNGRGTTVQSDGANWWVISIR